MPRRNLLWLLSVVIASFVCWQGAPRADEDAEKYEFYRKLVDALDHIEKSYVTQVDRNQLLEGALQGMLGTLDPYSTYIGPGHFRQFEKQTEGHFGGLGIQIGKESRTGPLTVISPLVGTPAYKAGIMAGDKILEIEGESTDDISLDDAVNKLTGRAGTQVTITILHEGQEEPQKLTLTREEIKIESVQGDHRKADDTWDWIIDKENKVAYVRINSFIGSTGEDLEKALRQAREDGMRALVLDMRFNPGGLLQSAIEVSDMFLKGGRIVSTKGRDTDERKWDATGHGKHVDFPLAILVNRYSASASEIVAAALQDNERATVVGERTWGKGSVQNVIELEDGKSALKLTTAEYHRPNGHNIHKREKAKESDEWGVMPDKGFEVKFSTEDLVRYGRHRRDRDIVRQAKATDSPPPLDDNEPWVDKQLQKAVERVLDQLKGQDKAVSQK